MSETLATPSSSAAVRVRMYRHGLGDCFLLTLPSEGERPFYLMIDCGVILGTKDASAKMKEVVADIITTTSGQVDLLVITHEHYDHLSGFLQAKTLFAKPAEEDGGDDAAASTDKLQIHNLWLAWTEDPKDELAQLLRGERKRVEHGLRLALQGLREAEMTAASGNDGAGNDGVAVPVVSQQVETLLGFFGAAGRRGTAGALEMVHALARSPARFLRPTDAPLELPEVPGIRFYVLGPPQDEALIKRSRPSRAHSEVYEAAFGLTPETAFLAAALDGPAAAAAGVDEFQETSQPFDRRYRIPLPVAEQLPFFKQAYWGEANEEDYRDQSWRRIDSEWHRSAVDLALKLDNDTNNSSLVLAIEIVSTGEVLLFPGDAQVGNWLSWKDVHWTLEDGAEVSAHDLLARTVLYKVAHHGSHNATLREQGLELMTHDDLVAMVPVDHDMAVKKRWGKIPFEPLMQRLHQKASGRVLRSDSRQKIQDQKAPDGVPTATWRRFQQRVVDEELYFEYRLDD